MSPEYRRARRGERSAVGARRGLPVSTFGGRAVAGQMRWATVLAVLLLVSFGEPARAQAPTSEACLECHNDDSMTMERGGRTVSLYVKPATLKASAHAKLACVQCHVGFDPESDPHKSEITPVQCGSCHEAVQALHAKSVHGRAIARGDPLAPRCKDCHGTHDVLPAADSRSPVFPLRVPFLCGKCHQEGAPIHRQQSVREDQVLENFSESIHGQALVQKGLIVAANCVSCHTPHSTLPSTDPTSSIARRNIAHTCRRCHAEIEQVHAKVIKSELWAKEVHVLPACVDCHRPHKVGTVAYDQGMAGKDCMRCHANPRLTASADGRSLYVRAGDLSGSMHAKLSCGQCHVGITASRHRPCETITQKVDCSSCHAGIGRQYLDSKHGELMAKHDPEAPTCVECHGTHGILGKTDPSSATFPTNVPELCARCHREGEKAAKRYKGSQHDIIQHYVESIHGMGLMKSGLTVTAMCTSCHTAHGVLPKDNPVSSVNRNNIPATCGRCHYGIEEQFRRSVHATRAGKTKRELPVCNDCHTAHTITRTDATGFKLEIMGKCGRCHEEIAKTYFDTYHGKVSQLGYTKTAKCYDCHGAHDILPVSDPRSPLSRDHVVQTCRKCHEGATSRFAGYLTHATHHDRKKYPFLFWTFWGMVALLVGTFTIGGIHTLLWLPRGVQLRREWRAESAAAFDEAETAAAAEAPPAEEPEKGTSDER